MSPKSKRGSTKPPATPESRSFRIFRQSRDDAVVLTGARARDFCLLQRSASSRRSLLTKDAMATGAGLEHHAARELVRTLLSTDDSGAIAALVQDLQHRKVFLSPKGIVALVHELIG